MFLGRVRSSVSLYNIQCERNVARLLRRFYWEKTHWALHSIHYHAPSTISPQHKQQHYVQSKHASLIHPPTHSLTLQLGDKSNPPTPKKTRRSKTPSDRIKSNPNPNPTTHPSKREKAKTKKRKKKKTTLAINLQNNTTRITRPSVHDGRPSFLSLSFSFFFGGKIHLVSHPYQ